VINITREVVHPGTLVYADAKGGLVSREGIQTHKIDGPRDVIPIWIYRLGEVLADVEGPLLTEGVG
jgi:hypothetical protein